MALTTEARKILAKGAIVKIDTITQGRIETADLPKWSRDYVEAPELNPQDDGGTPLQFDPLEAGDEMPGEFQFTQYWDPRNVKALSLETKFANCSNVAVAVVLPAPDNGGTISFSGKIKELGIAQLAKKNFMKRTVVIIRTSAITNALSA